MWVIGGDDAHHEFNDVWYSYDGVNWICATESAPWTPRDGHTSVVFDNKMWVTGGSWGGDYLLFNDVWYSADGSNWTCATDSAPWLSRRLAASVVFKSRIWLLGGYHLLVTAIFNDVWCSSNGVDWNCVTTSAEWGERFGYSSVIFDDKIWVIGGAGRYSFFEGANKVWCSADGAHWHCVTDSAPWQGRCYHPSVVFNNKLWILGGDSSGGPANDVWYGEIVHEKR
jgi:N-acetylneuraminic acid mutarotase